MNLWGHHNLWAIAYSSESTRKLIMGNQVIDLPLNIPRWIYPKYLKSWVVSLLSDTSINQHPDPAVISGMETPKQHSIGAKKNVF